MTDHTHDRSYNDPELAGFYNLLNPSREDTDFYLELVMSASAVLDVGCGTGTLLHRARDAGHAGRLCGLDPAAAMLDQARARTDIEWVLGTAASAGWNQEFDLVVMTGHAFQEFVKDDELRASLAAIRAALVDGGRFVFEILNPARRPWESWNPQNSHEFVTMSGTKVSLTFEVPAPIHDGVLRINATYTSSAWDEPQVDTGQMRFLDVDALSAFLSEAGLAVDEQFGDWTRAALTPGSPEIITVARRAGG